MVNYTPPTSDIIELEEKHKKELKVLTDLILKLRPDYKEWILKHYGELYK